MFELQKESTKYLNRLLVLLKQQNDAFEEGIEAKSGILSGK